MKKKYLVLFLILLSLPLYGQKLNSWKNLSVIANTRDLNCVIDYSGASILNETFDDWVKGEPDWDSSFYEICSKFRQSFNGNADKGKHPHRVGTFPDAEYSLVLHVLKVKDKGSNVQVQFEVVTKDGEVIFSQKGEGKQGRYGSVANLMSDAFEDLGGKLGLSFVLHFR